MTPELIAAEFDAVEIQPCAIVAIDSDGPTLEVCERDDPDLHCWTVYLHKRIGGVRAIADCATEADALIIADALEREHPCLRGEAA
jgi:hypothetical protein